jgi:60 kDa SS-A/Ro ribonucleoprotein
MPEVRDDGANPSLPSNDFTHLKGLPPMTYAAHLETQNAPKTDAMGRFTIDKWEQLNRFLILGCEGGTYTASEQKLTRENATSITACLAEDAQRTIDRIVKISETGRAPKNDPMIFALALAATSADLKTRQAAFAAMPKVCRTGTHLFHFAQELEALGQGWSRSKRRAFANWYLNRSADRLAMQLIKYQQRDGMSHARLLQMCHPVATSEQQNAAFRWVATDPFDLGERTIGGDFKKHSFPVRKYAAIDQSKLPDAIQAFERIKKATEVKDVIQLIKSYDLPHECVPNDFKNDPQVWEALLEGMKTKTTALLRNLNKMTASGLLAPMSDASKRVADMLTDAALLKAGRIHPMQILIALSVYSQGKGIKGKLTWTPVQEITDALDQAFYQAFETVEPTNKKHLLAVDVSGSMSWASALIAGTHLHAREAAAAMALITSKKERCVAIAFSSDPTPVNLGKSRSVMDVINEFAKMPAAATDCSYPMRYAKERKLDIDTFVIYTDNEHNAKIPPHQALAEYRDFIGHDAKLIAVGMAANAVSIADPNDANCLNVCGFDSAVPEIMSYFTRDMLSQFGEI